MTQRKNETALKKLQNLLTGNRQTHKQTYKQTNKPQINKSTNQPTN